MIIHFAFALLSLSFQNCNGIMTINMLKQYNTPRPMWYKLSSGLKQQSRKWFIERAETLGVPWSSITSKYTNPLSFHNSMHLKTVLENLNIKYPSYYLQPFHGYDEGNLNWDAAQEAEAATLSISSNYWKNTDPYTSAIWFRNNITEKIETYRNLHNLQTANNILDIGCSIGISTENIRNLYKSAYVWGVDLSPYFLSIAEQRNIEFHHNLSLIHI